MSNNIKILPFLIEPGRIANWISFFIAILEFNQEAGNQLI